MCKRHCSDEFIKQVFPKFSSPISIRRTSWLEICDGSATTVFGISPFSKMFALLTTAPPPLGEGNCGVLWGGRRRITVSYCWNYDDEKFCMIGRLQLLAVSDIFIDVQYEPFFDQARP